jgi:IS5 family transposase
MKKNKKQISFTDTYISRRRKSDIEFFSQINSIVNWEKLDKTIKQYYCKDNKKTGRKAYSKLLLFKICLLKIWYNLSDEKLENYINDSLSFMRFLNLKIEDNIPDTSTIGRFRRGLVKNNMFANLLEIINKQLADNNFSIKNGEIIEPKLRKTKKNNKTLLH